MSLNWKEINLVLDELDLSGQQIQKALQVAYDVLLLKLYGRNGASTLLIALTPGATRLHSYRAAAPKRERPLRFAEFLNSRVINGRIEEYNQLGDNRIVRIVVRRGETRLFLYLRLWSNAANIIVTDETGTILDAMRRLPKRGEITGGHYQPEETLSETSPQQINNAPREFSIRELPGEGSFNERLEVYYAEQGGALSLEALREKANKLYTGKINRLESALEKLRIKESAADDAEKFREYGDLLLANASLVHNGDSWLEVENFYDNGALIRLPLDSKKSAAANAESFYEKYRKAKHGLEDVRLELQRGEAEKIRLENELADLLAETNPLRLHKILRSGGSLKNNTGNDTRKRPGLSFKRGDWLIIVGRDASENDELLRRHVKGNDTWLHVRDFAGSYVFIKQRSGKSIPLDILLDAGNLAVFYSKGRNNGEADLYYTPVKYLRRAKGGPKGLVIPTQEKNLHIKVDANRLRELESCKV